MEGLLERYADNVTALKKLKEQRREIAREMEALARKHILYKHAREVQCVEGFCTGSDEITLYLKGDMKLWCYNLYSHDRWYIRFFGKKNSAECFEGRIDDDDGLTEDERAFITNHLNKLVCVAEKVGDEWRDYNYNREKYIQNILNNEKNKE
jgi:hypothetical protein